MNQSQNPLLTKNTSKGSSHVDRGGGGTKMIFFQTSEGKNSPWLTLPGEKLEAGTGTGRVGNNRKVLECRALSSAGRIKEL